MYKKILVLVIGLSFILRAMPMSIYFIGGRQSLPIAVLAFSGVMVAFAVYIIAKMFVKGIDIKEIIAYFTLDFVSVLFNLVFSAFYASVGSTDIIDTLIVGNVFVLAMNPILIYFAIKKDKYISVPNKVVESSPDNKVNDELKIEPVKQSVEPQQKEDLTKTEENVGITESIKTSSTPNKKQSPQKNKDSSNKKKSKKGKKSK